MIKILQYNENHSSLARDVLLSKIVSKNIDIIFICDKCKSNYVPTNYKKIIHNKLMIIYRSGLPLSTVYAHNTYNIIIVTIYNINIIVSYIPPNELASYYFQFLDIYLRNNNLSKFILLGDLNSRNLLWDTVNNQRGKHLLNIIQTHDLNVLNVKNKHTFQRGNQKSVIDITLATSNITDLIEGWDVSYELNASDHYYVTFNINIVTNRKCDSTIKAINYNRLAINLRKYIYMIDTTVCVCVCVC